MKLPKPAALKKSGAQEEKAPEKRARKKDKTNERGVTKGERILLLIGDEGGVLVHMKKGKVLSRIFSPGPAAAETAKMPEYLRRISRAPFYMVFDTVDQSYVQQTLPPVSSFSVNKLIKRRLERDFSGDYIKGAYLLGREEGGRKDWQFMMAAMQQSPVVKSWLEVVAQWPMPCRGLLLLPVESTEIMLRLKRALVKERKEEEATPPQWQILVSYNKVSGIRQAIFRKDKLVLTRLGQPALDSTSEAIAGTIEQEIVGTKEYLKRLSQQENEVLHVLVLASEDICQHVDATKLRADHVDTLTPFQAANLLHLEGAAQPTDRFADSFLCAALGTNRKKQLVLSVGDLQQQYILNVALHGQRVIAAGLALMLTGYTLNLLWDVYAMTDEMSELEQKQSTKTHEMSELKKKSPRSGEDLDRITGVVSLYEAINKEAYTPEGLLMMLSQTLADNVSISEFSWALRDKKIMVQKPVNASVSAATTPTSGHASVPGKAKDKDGMEAESTLTLEFPSGNANDRERLQEQTTDILNKVKTKLPDFQVFYSALPSLISDSERIDVNLGQGQNAPQAPSAKATQARMALIGPADTGEDNASEQK